MVVRSQKSDDEMQPVTSENGSNNVSVVDFDSGL